MIENMTEIEIWLKSRLTSCLLLPKNALLKPKFRFVWLTITPFPKLLGCFSKIVNKQSKKNNYNELFVKLLGC